MQSIIRFVIVCAISGAISLAIVWGIGTHINVDGPLGIPLVLFYAIVAFAIQWLAFIPAFLFQTEKFYDLCGSLTFITLALLAVWFQPNLSITNVIIASMVVIWALRLGTFLFIRILRDGLDSRFSEIKPHPLRFLSAWTLQGLWVFVTSSPAIAVIATQPTFENVHWLSVCGMVLWMLGFSAEVVADAQKRRHRAHHKNQFICRGLWAYSRHPNYAGEIILWVGITIIALPIIQGWQYLVLLSPILVYTLLTRVSGIPLLEAKADERWANNPDYESYKTRVPVLWPTFTTADE